MTDRPAIPHTYTIPWDDMDMYMRHTAILRALLEALECRGIDELMSSDPELVRAVGAEITKAAKLGAHLYPGLK